MATASLTSQNSRAGGRHTTATVRLHHKDGEDDGVTTCKCAEPWPLLRPNLLWLFDAHHPELSLPPSALHQHQQHSSSNTCQLPSTNRRDSEPEAVMSDQTANCSMPVLRERLWLVVT